MRLLPCRGLVPCLALVASLWAASPVPAAALPPLTLERIMADPDWIGPAVEAPYWALDGRAVYYKVKRAGSPVRDLHRITLADGRDVIVGEKDLANLDVAGAVLDRTHRRAVFVRNGDLFVRESATGALRQLTRSVPAVSRPSFSADGRRVQYLASDAWWSVDLSSGLVERVANVVASRDPDPKRTSDLEALQLRLIQTLSHDRADRDSLQAQERRLRAADPTRGGTPFYLGEEVKIEESHLSPAGTWMLVVTTPKGHDEGRVGKMPRYVTESGYEETEDTRTRVGRNAPAPQTLWLLDLVRHRVTRLSTAALPGLHDDPLAAIRAENDSLLRASGEAPAKRDTASAHEAQTRAFEVGEVVFAPDGAHAAVQLRAIDNKDRWIATVANADTALAPQHRLHDEAWINWSFNDLGWLPDGRALWYLSEEEGHSRLYLKPLEGVARALTPAGSEASQVTLSADGRMFQFVSNAEAPYAYDAYRVPVTGGAIERLTTLRGVERVVASPDGGRLLVLHSSSHTPAQLALVAASGGAVRTLTDTRTSQYRGLEWPEPRLVAVPSSHGAAPIWSKFHDVLDARGQTRHPIVLFVHGAGYTQNTTLKFPYYFREQMFNHLLTQRGFLVLEMDYRASEGYGRDWRTAIYRRMGTPELEDLIDGVRWLVREHGGDSTRVGVYGGSYGGFMTLMALFKAPEVFHAGAALRPVTDWTQYNHGYTSNILNTPQVDPIAYRRSSPIEFASGLRGSLLICHGIIDDNVLFEDSVRLWQRLLELHKTDTEFAPYPMERHGFTHADSWLDEYSRIDRLFETRLGTPR